MNVVKRGLIRRYATSFRASSASSNTATPIGTRKRPPRLAKGSAPWARSPGRNLFQIFELEHRYGSAYISTVHMFGKKSSFLRQLTAFFSPSRNKGRQSRARPLRERSRRRCCLLMHVARG